MNSQGGYSDYSYQSSPLQAPSRQATPEEIERKFKLSPGGSGPSPGPWWVGHREAPSPYHSGAGYHRGYLHGSHYTGRSLEGYPDSMKYNTVYHTSTAANLLHSPNRERSINNHSNEMAANSIHSPTRGRSTNKYIPNDRERSEMATSNVTHGRGRAGRRKYSRGARRGMPLLKKQTLQAQEESQLVEESARLYESRGLNGFRRHQSSEGRELRTGIISKAALDRHSLLKDDCEMSFERRAGDREIRSAISSENILDRHLLSHAPVLKDFKDVGMVRHKHEINYIPSPLAYSRDSMYQIQKSPYRIEQGALTPLVPLAVDVDPGMLESGRTTAEADGEVSGLPLVPQEECMPTTARPSPNCKDTDLCLICGDRASGYHYNALSCEGCKGFFRRSITRQAKYACKYGGRCELDMWMRRRCQACRLRRCRDVGMREECLLSDKQCLARSARRQIKRKSTDCGGRHSSTPRSRSRTCTADETVVKEDTCDQAEYCLPDGECLSSCAKETFDKIVDKLCDGHQAVVKCLVVYQDKYELPSEDDLAQLSSVKVNEEQEPVDDNDKLFLHMVEMTVLVTRLVISFAKSLPGFISLDKEDQVSLLKGSASEVMMLRTARRYDPQTDTVVFGNGSPFSANSMKFGGLQGYIDAMFEFSRGMSKLMLDDAEYSLITALSIFSVRPGLKDIQAVEQIQEIYLEVLLAYISHRRAGSRSYVAKLLMKLVELRSLSALHTQVLKDLKLEKKSLPPLLSEYFNIND